MKLALLIDPDEKIVKEIMLEETVTRLNEILGCPQPGGTLPLMDDSGVKHMMWAGLHMYERMDNHIPCAFRIQSLFGDSLFFGKSLMIGYSIPEGTRTDCMYRLEYIVKHIRFLSQEESIREHAETATRYEKMFEF